MGNEEQILKDTSANIKEALRNETFLRGEDKMPDRVYVFGVPSSIGDFGFTTVTPKDDYIEYTRTAKVNELLEGVKGALEFYANKDKCLSFNSDVVALNNLGYDNGDKAKQQLKAINEFMGEAK